MHVRQTSFISQALFLLSLAFVIYMPLHIFIAQSASLLTGGIEVWKAAKDVVLFLAVPLMLYESFTRGLFRDRTFQVLFGIGVAYVLVHGVYLVFDGTDDTYSALVGTIYNTRLLAYTLLGYLVGVAKDAKKYTKQILTAAALVATVVAIFGVLQYFLPHDLLTHVGYSIERGVKPLFFIDDKPDLPRVMSTLRDPNSLAAYLMLPMLAVGYALVKTSVNKNLFVRPFRREVLVFMLGSMALCFFLTFSRGAVIGMTLSTVTILYIVTGEWGTSLLKRYWPVVLTILILCVGLFAITKDSYVVQNVIFHADQSTVSADPNEIRVQLAQEVSDEVLATPFGHGPGSAGLVSVNNPQGTVLTENYYLQVAYEVGWIGVLLFVLLLLFLMGCLYGFRSDSHAVVVFAAGSGYIFYSLLIHLWSNEAVALQWWLFVGLTIGYMRRSSTAS